MISKDLLYALQSRSNKMIKELDGFTSNIKQYSLEDASTVVAETIKLVKETAPTQPKYSHLIKAVNCAWLTFADQSEAAANQLYDAVLTELEETTWTHPDAAQVAYQLLYAFHNKQIRSANDRLRLALRQHSPRILALIGRIAPHSAEILFATPVKPDTGAGADAIEMLFRIYFYHVSLCDDNDLRAEAAGLILPLVRENRGIGSNLTLSLLEYHPERSAILSQLIDLYIVGEECKNSMCCDLMLELLDNSGDSFIYADLDKITTRLAVASKQWTSSQLDTFARYAFFYGLDTDEDRRLLLAKSKKANRLARMIVDAGRSGEYIDAINLLLQAPTNQPAAPAPSKAGAGQFKDLNFKLLVIQELMYDQKKLVPRFDVDEFIRLHTDREIMLEAEGYDVIPEVLAYFEGLLIPSPLLADVEELAFDGSSEVYHQVFPYWDGECDTFDVKSIADIALVPNLKRFSCMPSAFVEQFEDALSKKSIEAD
jgi:hypothetical protein